jgi:tripartite-type tricarboxylate transporter receptor subunit TctC
MKKFAMLSMLLMAACAMPAIAQTFPSQPITIVIPYTSGGSTDLSMRVLQPKMSEKLGQPIVIDYKPGASGNIGATYVARAKPDGYTLYMQSTIMGMYPHVFTNLQFDPLKDFAMIGSMVESPTVFVVHADSPYKTLADVVADAKKKPGGLNVGSGGTGSPAHLAAEQLARLNGFKITHVPYKGTAPVLNDLLGGRLDFASLSVGAVQTFLQNGQARALVIASPNRSPIVPNVPTTKEAGFAEMNGGVRYFLAAPAGTPKDRIAVIGAALDVALQDKDNIARLRQAGFDVVPAGPAKTQAMLQEQYDMWGPIVKELNLKME